MVDGDGLSSVKASAQSSRQPEIESQPKSWSKQKMASFDVAGQNTGADKNRQGMKILHVNIADRYLHARCV